MLGFIIAVVAGFITPQLDAPVARPIVKWLEKHMSVEASETRLVSFMAALIAAGVASSLLHSGTAFWVIAGALLGYFLTRIVEAAKKTMDARKAKNQNHNDL